MTATNATCILRGSEKSLFCNGQMNCFPAWKNGLHATSQNALTYFVYPRVLGTIADVIHFPLIIRGRYTKYKLHTCTDVVDHYRHRKLHALCYSIKHYKFQ